MLALATCAVLPAEANEAPLEAALTAAGVAHEWVPWDRPDHDWSRYDAVLIRTPWDYHERLEAFVAWADLVDAGTALWNPAPVVRWNTHKGYLLELAAAGLPVVPTVVVAAGEPPPAGVAAVAPGAWGEVVVKPAVSVGAIGAVRGRPGDDAVEAGLAGIVGQGGDAVIQPFLPAVTADGETSTVVIGGRVSHAVRKVPAAGDYRSQPEHGGRLRTVEPTAAHRAVADAALQVVSERFGRILYARVDTVDIDGAPHVIEVELVEPDLFWAFGPGSAEAMVAALAEVTGRR